MLTESKYFCAALWFIAIRICIFLSESTFEGKWDRNVTKKMSFSWRKDFTVSERMCGIVLQGFFNMTLGHCNPSLCVCVLLTCGSHTHAHKHTNACRCLHKFSHSQQGQMMSCQSDLHRQSWDGEECIHGPCHSYTCAVCGFLRRYCRV